MPFQISATYVWLGLTIIFAIAEAATTAMVSIWFVIGALAAMLVSIVFDSMAIQVIVFIVVSAVTLIYSRPILAKKMLKTTPTNADMIIGKRALVVQDIGRDTPGRVSIDGLTWLAKSDTDIAKGDYCNIEKIEGVTLWVTQAQTVKM